AAGAEAERPASGRRAGAGAARARGARRAAGPLPRAALGRRAAARGAGARVRERAGRAVRGRADRQPGCGERRGGRGPARRAEPRAAHDAGAGDARCEARGARGTRDPARGRADRVGQRQRGRCRAAHERGWRTAGRRTGRRCRVNVRFALRMARRELRAHRRRILVYMGAIATGVAALVAVNSFRSDVARAVSRDARSILGADLELRRRDGFTEPVQALIDSLEAAGHETARAVRFGSMVYTTANRNAPRLLDVNALEGGYPFYGTVATEPAEAWQAFRAGRRAVVDPAVLVYLGAAVGDTLRIGDAAFEIAGVLTEYPGELGVRVAVGPRVFIPRAYVEETNLLRFGSLASHRAYFRIEDTEAVGRLVDAYEALFDAERTRVETVAEVEEELGETLGSLARFLGLVALAALLLGCVGVASAV